MATTWLCVVYVVKEIIRYIISGGWLGQLMGMARKKKRTLELYTDLVSKDFLIANKAT